MLPWERLTVAVSLASDYHGARRLTIPRRRLLSRHTLPHRLPIQASQGQLHYPCLPPEHQQQRQHLSRHSEGPMEPGADDIKRWVVSGNALEALTDVRLQCCSLSAQCSTTPIPATRWYRKSPTYTTPTGLDMSPPLGNGRESMQSSACKTWEWSEKNGSDSSWCHVRCNGDLACVSIACTGQCSHYI